MSIGYNPQRIISALLACTFGNTKPGQSHNVTSSVNFRVWKCLVLPGILATPTFFLPNKALMTLDLPTLGYPVSPIYTPFSVAYCPKITINCCGDITLQQFFSNLS